MRSRGILAALAVAFLLCVSPLAADTVIKRGIDVFTTTDNGKTFYDFAKGPIPAGFFCAGSAPFTGRVALKGMPLETGKPAGLRGADTVIERLDDATFDDKGRATTRIRFRALSLVSIEPVRTSCGAYHVYVTLGGKQRVTTMHIERTRAGGGVFRAPLAVDARMTFVPVKKTRSLPQAGASRGSFTFPATPIPWSYEGGPGAKRIVEAVVVDTNGDLVPETRLSGTTNFAPGWSLKVVTAPYCVMCEPPSCHEDSTGKQHCTGGYTACNGAHCP